MRCTTQLSLYVPPYCFTVTINANVLVLQMPIAKC